MLDIHLCGHHFIAHPQRALYWPAQSMLLIADVHLGKADTFRQFGIGVPQLVQDRDLANLQLLLGLWQPQRLVVLGDLVHGRIVGSSTVAAWNQLVDLHPSTQFELVLGNHDRSFQAGVLTLHQIHRHLLLDGVYLSHEPVDVQALPAQSELNIHGHIHAAIQLEGSRSKLPALAYTPPHLSMPAFSEFTAGAQVPAQCEKLWVFAPEADLVAQVH